MFGGRIYPHGSLSFLLRGSFLKPGVFLASRVLATRGHRWSSRSYSVTCDDTDNYQVTVKVKGPHECESNDHREELLTQLENIPHDTHCLRITEDTPPHIEWSLLSKHFRNVRDLELHTGFNEELTDEGIPAHWPLRRLFISDACAEVFRSPFVLEGKVESLVLLGTSGLRFEGPTSEELYRTHGDAVSRGDKEPRYVTVQEGTPEERKIELIWLPDLVVDQMNKRYAGTRAAQLPTSQGNHNLQCLPREVQSNMAKLEIIENDAIDTFNRMAMALPHVVEKLATLNLRSTHALDFHFTAENLFISLLPQLSELQTLVLSVGEVFENEDTLPNLYASIPAGITTLRFRGPASLVRSSQWDTWVESFAST
ncbi:hypothetical protein P168DRAFT_330593 [Aspergillus campestris IBT 28561]|uniref:Uncharacterized protein n=1 Tax=Aspergillus campestris (strain IBT 28561) TaxID=1392248 RepID=A0A2I1CQV0_ASPC2|nr:uncharacterized protein P168DRAFT_330593 [Aspergillus campestris IBT 28561]PKY00006.1 hypothetical protein P168DRAFT_330593 [Aspergillus campestris IBT 28561]